MGRFRPRIPVGVNDRFAPAPGMKKIAHYLGEFGRLALLSWKYSRHYGSISQNTKVFLLRLAATNPGRRVFRRKLYGLDLRAPARKTYVRSGTSDILVLHETFELGAYNAALRWRLPSKPVILDLGGNIGLGTVFFSTIFPDATIVVAEPDAGNCEVLRMNCRSLIETNRVKVVSAFVGAQDGVAAIDRAADNWEFRKIQLKDTTAEAIECLSIPSLLRRTGLNRIDLIKCDIEGSEAELFKSCREWIAQVGFLIVETHQPYSLPELYKNLGEAGWQFNIVKEWTGRSISLCFLERRAAA